MLPCVIPPPVQYAPYIISTYIAATVKSLPSKEIKVGLVQSLFPHTWLSSELAWPKWFRTYSGCMLYVCHPHSGIQLVMLIISISHTFSLHVCACVSHYPMVCLCHGQNRAKYVMYDCTVHAYTVSLPMVPAEGTSSWHPLSHEALLWRGHCIYSVLTGPNRQNKIPIPVGGPPQTEEVFIDCLQCHNKIAKLFFSIFCSVID